MLDGRVLGASQVEYKPFGKPPLKREELFLPKHRLVMESARLPGLRHVVDADDEGQATREECVSQLRVKDQVVAPSRTAAVHAAAGENVRRVSVDALVRQAAQSA